MKNSNLTVRIPDNLAEQLADIEATTGFTRAQAARVGVELLVEYYHRSGRQLALPINLDSISRRHVETAETSA